MEPLPRRAAQASGLVALAHAARGPRPCIPLTVTTLTMALLPRWKAEAYTLLACCATAALSRAAREGGTDYPCCARVLREALHERRSYSSVPAPAAYTNLTGPLSLCSADPAWARLCERGGPPPEVGIEIVTSAVGVAVASAECFQSAQGFAATLSRGGVTELLAVESRGTVGGAVLLAPQLATLHRYPASLPWPPTTLAS